MEPRSMKKLVSRVNSILICVLLCITHLIILSVDYFEFKTIALFAPYIPFEQTLPFVAICVEPQLGQMDISINSTFSMNNVDHSSVLEGCKLRNFTSKQVEPIQCSDGFETTRSIMRQSYHCYTIKPKMMTTYMILEAVAVVKDRQVLYTFLLSDQFNQYTELIPLMFFRRRPDSEFDFSRSIELANATKNLFFKVGYELIQYLRLPPPYETSCIDESICLDESGETHGWCERQLCVDNVTLTHTEQLVEAMNGIFMQVTSLASPITRVAYAPGKRSSYYILEIFSLLGLWINFSIHLVFTSSVACISKVKSRPANRIAPIVLNLRASTPSSSHRVTSLKTSQPAQNSMKSIVLWKILVRTAVVVFFARESYVISVNYFHFKTHVYIHLRTNEMSEYPSVSHCVDIYEFLDYQQPDRSYQSYDKLMTQFAQGFNYTLREIFELTPATKSAVASCQIRESSKTPLITTSNCSRDFSVSKFFFGEFLCYKFEPLMQFIQPVNFEHDISIIYSLILSEQLVPKFHYQTIVSYNFPHQSRFLTQEQWRTLNNRLLELAFITYRYKQLPAPYDTHCGLYENTNQCEMNCLNLNEIGLVSFSYISTEPIDSPVINYEHLKTESVAAYVQQAEERCKNACPKPCDDEFVQTVKQESESNYHHQLTLLSPKYPVYEFEAHPFYTMYEYIYQLACSASFWIGLSFILILNIAIRSKSHPPSSPVSSPPENRPNMLFVGSIKTSDSPAFQRLILKRKLSQRTIETRLRKSLSLASLTAGFCVHTFINASVYFEYPASMDTRMAYNDNHTQLKTTVCISIDQLDLRGDYSLHNIWSQSPSANEFLVECAYRGIQIPELSHLPDNLVKKIMPYINSTSLCNSLLRVKKFTTLGLVCYEVTPSESAADTEYRTEYQIGDNRVYGYFIMSPEVSKYNLTLAMSQGPSLNALFIPATLFRAWATSPCVYYYAYYVKYQITSLPNPYNMGVYDSLKRINCIRGCLGSKMRRLKVFSPYDTATSPSFLQHETETQSMQAESMELRSQCESTCKYKRHLDALRDVYFNSYSIGPRNWSILKRWNGTISIWSMTGGFLVTETTFYPEFKFVDLVIFVGSLFSVWFGQSVLSLVNLLLSKIISVT